MELAYLQESGNEEKKIKIQENRYRGWRRCPIPRVDFLNDFCIFKLVFSFFFLFYVEILVFCSWSVFTKLTGLTKVFFIQWRVLIKRGYFEFFNCLYFEKIPQRTFASATKTREPFIIKWTVAGLVPNALIINKRRQKVMGEESI